MGADKTKSPNKDKLKELILSFLKEHKDGRFLTIKYITQEVGKRIKKIDKEYVITDKRIAPLLIELVDSQELGFKFEGRKYQFSLKSPHTIIKKSTMSFDPSIHFSAIIKSNNVNGQWIGSLELKNIYTQPFWNIISIAHIFHLDSSPRIILGKRPSIARLDEDKTIEIKLGSYEQTPEKINIVVFYQDQMGQHRISQRLSSHQYNYESTDWIIE